MNTGNREYSCSRNSARRSPIVASSRMATMSGRGVITSRTSVSPKSTMLCSSRRSSPSMMPFLLAGRRGRPSSTSLGFLGRVVVGDGVPAPRRRATVRAVQRVTGPSSPGDRAERRQQQLEHPLGIAADDQQRQQQLADDHERRRRSTMTSDQRSAPLDADRRGQQRRRRRGDQAEQQPDRHEQQERIVEVVAERVRPVAALGDEPQRQPHQRAERGLDGAEVHRDAREQEDQRAESSCASGPLDREPSRRPPFRRSRRSTRAIAPVVALVIVAEQVQQAVQRQHAQFGRARSGRPRAPAAARRRGRSRCRPETGDRRARRPRSVGVELGPARPRGDATGKLSTSVA